MPIFAMIQVREKKKKHVLAIPTVGKHINEWIVACKKYAALSALIGDQYAQLVFRSGNSDSLWSLKAIYSMCEMEQNLVIQNF